VITTGWDGKILSWDPRIKASSHQHLIGLTAHAESMSLWGFELLVATGSLLHKHDLRKLDGAICMQDLSMGVPIRCVRSVPCWEGTFLPVLEAIGFGVKDTSLFRTVCFCESLVSMENEVSVIDFPCYLYGVIKLDALHFFL